MEKSKEKERILSDYKSVGLSKSSSGYCPKCGAFNELNSLFCEECGASFYSDNCHNCGSPLEPGIDVCEHCNSYLLKDICSFCGSNMAADDAFCPECGLPHGSIKCSVCHTQNTTNFCSKCGNPLTELAFKELEKAKKEPYFVRMTEVAQELKELEQQLELLNNNQDVAEKTLSVSNDLVPPVKSARQIEKEKRNETLRKSVLDLLDQDFVSAPSLSPTGNLSSDNEQKRKSLFEKKSAEEMEALIKQKKAELQEILDKMEPCPELPPALSRNYYEARKPGCSSLVWECNHKHYIHPDPYNCAHPQKGGKWIVADQKVDWQYGIE